MKLPGYLSDALWKLQEGFNRGMRQEVEPDYEQTIIMTKERADAARAGKKPQAPTVKPEAPTSKVSDLDFSRLDHNDPRLAHAPPPDKIFAATAKKQQPTVQAKKPSENPPVKPAVKPKEAPWKSGKSLKDIFLMVTTAASIILGGTALHQHGKNSALTDQVNSLEKEVQTLRTEKRTMTGKIVAVAKSAEDVLVASREIVAESQKQQAESDQYRLQLSQSLSELEEMKNRLSKKGGVAKVKSQVPQVSLEKARSTPSTSVEQPVAKKVSSTPVSRNAEPSLKLKPSNLVLGLIARINTNLPEGSTLRAEPSAEGTRIIYDDPVYTRFHTHERPENANIQDEQGKKAWAEQQYIRGIDCQRLGQTGIPKASQPYYCSSAKK